MSLSKKAYIISAIILTVLTATGAVFFLNIKGKQDEVVTSSAAEKKSLFAVPVDAVGIWLFESPIEIGESVFKADNLLSGLVQKENSLYKLINKINFLAKSESDFSEVASADALTSIHYSGKNEVSLLFCLNLSSVDASGQELLSARLTEGATVRSRNFNGANLISVAGAEISFYKGYLLASTSPLLVEASVRHLNSGTSIMDNADFSKIASTATFNGNLIFINHQQLGKLFSGLAASKYLGYADFASKLSAWSIATGDVKNSHHLYTGEFVNLKGVGNYASAITPGEKGDIRAHTIAPANTFALFSFTPGSWDNMISSVRAYRELHKKLNLELSMNAAEWIISQNPEEISIAAIPYGGHIEWVTMIRKGKSNPVTKFFSGIFSGKEKLIRDSVLKFDNGGKIRELIGSLFENNKEEYYLNRDNWTIIGSAGILEEFASGRSESFSMDDFISQTPVSGLAEFGGSPFTLSVNMTNMQDTVTSFFRKVIADDISPVLKKVNFGFIQFRMLPDEEKSGFELLLYAKNLEKLPTPPKPEENQGPAGWEKDSIVKVPVGPYELRNFMNGETEYLVQLSNYRLQLADKNLKGIWAVPFETPLRGFVEQIDYMNNGKLQMLFASGNKVYLLDRNGRFVNPYPKAVDDLIMLGPKVYKIDGEYAIMLLHMDNRLRLYDRECRPYPAWSDISTEETIKSFPELLTLGKNHYWILRTQLKTRIYTINGIEVTAALKQKELMPETPVKPYSDEEVIVKTTQGKQIRLNLETGVTKKVK